MSRSTGVVSKLFLELPTSSPFLMANPATEPAAQRRRLSGCGKLRLRVEADIGTQAIAACFKTG